MQKRESLVSRISCSTQSIIISNGGGIQTTCISPPLPPPLQRNYKCCPAFGNSIIPLAVHVLTLCMCHITQRPPSPPPGAEAVAPPTEEEKAPPPKPVKITGPFSLDMSKFQLPPHPKPRFKIQVAPRLTDMLGPEVSMPVLLSK